jgi:Effector-associated domain 11
VRLWCLERYLGVKNLFCFFPCEQIILRATAGRRRNRQTLVLLSGKLNAVQENHHLGLIEAAELNTEVNRVNFSLLELLNDLPDSFFQQAHYHIVADTPKQVSIPSGIGNGLFWMCAAFMMMICLGSLIQQNWIPFAFTLAATIICLPPTYLFLSRQLRISLSNSVRILLVVVLTAVGLSFAPKQAPVGGEPLKSGKEME